MPRVLLVEPDPFMQRTLHKLFSAEGYYCALSSAGEEAALACGSSTFDLVVLDLGRLPSDGLRVLREIRALCHVPVLALAPQGHVADTVLGLGGGADDYLCEPFDPRELLARVKAQLRRGDEYSRAMPEADRIDLGSVVLDVGSREALRDGAPLHLTAREFDLLHLLARHRGKALSSEWIFENVWGYDADLGVKGLKVYIRRLRAKIERDPSQPTLLLSVRGFGYRLDTR